MLGGGSKTMKSWILLHLAIAIHLGIDWLGFPTMKGKVLYLNFEISEFFMVERAKKICETLCVEYPEDMEFWHLRGFACSAELIIPVIIEKIRGEGYVLIIIDPTYKLMGDRDENAPGGVGDLLNQFERIAVETGAAVAFAAHYSKGNQASKEAIDRISGSGVFGRDPDTILPMTLHAEAHAFVIEPILRNFPPVAPFVLRWEYPLMQTDAELNPEHLKLPRMPRRQSKPTPTIEEFVGLFPKFAAATIEASTLDSQTIAKEFDDHLWKTGAIPELKKRACEEGHLKIKVLAHNRQLVGRPEIIAHFDAPQPQAQH